MKIALLATGDELTNGDILNTNGQAIAQHLFDEGFTIGQHVLVADHEEEIILAIEFLQHQHDVIFITGGLGPTSDDRTRFALAKATQHKLLFHQPSWEAIEARLSRYGFAVHQANKQQAFFPESAEVLLNPHGTAAGCRLMANNTLFFMLPGPPRECLPMFFEYALPYLIAHDKSQKVQQKKWRLFGVSEGEMATELDKLVKDYPVTTGYRWDYPYLEFKIRYNADFDSSELVNLVEARIQSHCICTTEKTAVEMLIDSFESSHSSLIILDKATSGLLEYRLSCPATFNKINFTSTKEAHIIIEGLQELKVPFNPNISHTTLEIRGHYQHKEINETCTIPFRDRRTLDWAVEFIAFKLRALLL